MNKEKSEALAAYLVDLAEKIRKKGALNIKMSQEVGEQRDYDEENETGNVYKIFKPTNRVSVIIDFEWDVVEMGLPRDGRVEEFPGNGDEIDLRLLQKKVELLQQEFVDNCLDGEGYCFCEVSKNDVCLCCIDYKWERMKGDIK